MNILAIDTTTKSASVSLKNSDRIYFESIENEITHSEKLLPLINKVLNEGNLSIKDIDNYAIINGPGSFTGIRIGLATIKAFSHVFEKDIFSISSLELIAMKTYMDKNLNDEKLVMSLIDAKNSRAYYALYKICKKDDKLIINAITNIENDTTENIINKLNSLPENEKVLLAGNLSFLPCCNEFYNTYPSTNDLIKIMDKLELDGYKFNAFNLKAIYARPSQAERVKNGEK